MAAVSEQTCLATNQCFELAPGDEGKPAVLLGRNRRCQHLFGERSDDHLSCPRLRCVGLLIFPSSAVPRFFSREGEDLDWQAWGSEELP